MNFGFRTRSGHVVTPAPSVSEGWKAICLGFSSKPSCARANQLAASSCVVLVGQHYLFIVDRAQAIFDLSLRETAASNEIIALKMPVAVRPVGRTLFN